jgi:homoprotocatechuate degradation regulator HpaR
LTPDNRFKLDAAEYVLETRMKHIITYPNLPQRMLKARDGLMAHFRPILNHFGLTEQQWRILRALDESSQLEPRELCDLCQISSPSMAGILLRMENAGLIDRDGIEGDQRRVIVHLSQKGTKLLDKIGPLIDLQYSYIEQACGKQIFVELFAALDKFIDLRDQPIKQVDLPSS